MKLSLRKLLYRRSRRRDASQEVLLTHPRRDWNRLLLGFLILAGVMVLWGVYIIWYTSGYETIVNIEPTPSQPAQTIDQSDLGETLLFFEERARVYEELLETPPQLGSPL